MGRPPNSNNLSSSSDNRDRDRDQPWTPPLWLTGEKPAAAGHGQRRQFTIRLPCPAAAVRRAVAARVQQQPGQAAAGQLSQLKGKLADQQARAQECQKKIVEAETAKEEALRDIRVLREKETAEALQELERRFKADQEKQIKEQEIKWRKQIEEEFNANRKRQREEEEAKEQQEEENPAKRLKLDSVDAGQLDGKKDEPTESEITAKETDAADAEASSDKKNDNNGVLLPSQVKRQELAELQSKLERLTENRMEMIWLLKRVIKAEEKQKAKAASQDNSTTKKPEAPPRLATSKQA